MKQRLLQSKHSQPFVRLETIRDMVLVAKKLAMVREAVREVNRLSGEISKERNEKWAKKLWLEMADVALKAQQWSDDAVVILKRVKKNAEVFLKEI